MLNSLNLRALLRCDGVRSSLASQNVAHQTIRRIEDSCLTLKNTFKCYNLEDGPSLDIELSRVDALTMYTQMMEARRFETLAGNYYKQRLIRGFCHLYSGQEAVAVGMKAMLRKQDSVVTAYRCHIWSYMMGISLYEMMSELLGFRTGSSRGKGGSMHMYTDHFYGGNGIVGAQVPLGTGVALAHQYRDDGGVCITLYGDGAANQGQVFESFNMAKLWSLPVVFVCENNHYGMGTKAERSSALTDYYKRGQYIPGLWVDGNQVLAVRTATQFALDYVLEHGPIVLEMNTYRYVGHSMSDPGISYRSREEVQTARETNDPITSFREQMLDLCLTCEEELKNLDDCIKKHVDSECKKALVGKEVELQELHTDVSVKNLEPKIRGVSGYNLDHIKLSEVCIGKPKKTPAWEINDVPVGDAVMTAKTKENEEKPVGKDGKPGQEGKPGKDVKAEKDSTSDGKKSEASGKEGKPPPVTDPKASNDPKKPPNKEGNPTPAPNAKAKDDPNKPPSKEGKPPPVTDPKAKNDPKKPPIKEGNPPPATNAKAKADPNKPPSKEIKPPPVTDPKAKDDPKKPPSQEGNPAAKAPAGPAPPTKGPGDQQKK